MNNNEWISVKERLPENRTDVLVYISLGYGHPITHCIFVERYCTETVDYKNTFVGVDGSMYPHEIVTHWMPLPKPPSNE
jgi:hypothetical protein